MKRVTSVCLLLVLTAAASAQEQGHLSVQTVVQKQQVTIDENGEQQVALVPAETVVPGENVVYTITFTNISDEAAANVVITNPIADSLSYVDGSAFGPGAEIQYSVDEGKTFAPREKLSVIEDGVARAARAEDVTHIRWVMQQELAAGAQGVARFSAVLE
jgi:uncharacterized repeat protein (TIGR01451 family)